MQIKEAGWVQWVRRVEFLGLGVPGCTEPILRFHAASSAQADKPTVGHDLVLREQALADLRRALLEIDQELARYGAATKQ